MTNHTRANQTVTITASEDIVIVGTIVYEIISGRDIPGLGVGFDIRDEQGNIDWISAEFMPKIVQLDFLEK